MITKAEIRGTVERYLLRFPDERRGLWRLTRSLVNEADLTSRKEFGGHVTTGAVIIGPTWQVLHVRHRALDRWLLPGGHLEPKDTSLLGATLRELDEETGMAGVAVEPIPNFEVVPLDVDVHPIPPSPDREEPEHWHFDFRHVFRASSLLVELQENELTDHRWLPLERVANVKLARKLGDLRDQCL